MINLHLVLGLRPTATPEELRTAYRQYARDTHPDTGGDARQFHEVREAYETLRDPAKRQAWQARYEAWALQHGAEVCKECFTAQRRRKTGNCEICGTAWPPSETAPPPFNPRLDRLRSDISDRFGDFLVGIGARLGDEIADAAKRSVDHGLSALEQRLGRKPGQRS